MQLACWHIWCSLTLNIILLLSLTSLATPVLTHSCSCSLRLILAIIHSGHMPDSLCLSMLKQPVEHKLPDRVTINDNFQHLTELIIDIKAAPHSFMSAAAGCVAGSRPWLCRRCNMETAAASSLLLIVRYPGAPDHLSGAALGLQLGSRDCQQLGSKGDEAVTLPAASASAWASSSALLPCMRLRITHHANEMPAAACTGLISS